MVDHEPHKIFKGDEFKSIAPWLVAYGELTRRMQNVAIHTLQCEASSLGKAIDGQADILTICPENLRMLPTLLRETADMLEDLMHKTGVKEIAEWSPSSKNTS